ncbi:hypothetical protein D3C85_699690 [compost metagenome]
MHTQPGAFRRRVHQMPERRAAAKAEIAALAQSRRWNVLRRQTGDTARHLRRGQPGAVDQFAAAQSHGFGTADVQLETLIDTACRQQWRMERQRPATGFDIALQRQHQPVGIDNPGGRRPQRGDAGQRRFKLPRLIGVQPLQVINAVAPPLFQQHLQGRTLRFNGGDDQLAQALIADAALIAEGVEALLALHAQLRLEAAAGVIDAGVDHFGIARADARADTFCGFEHNHFAPAHGHRPGDRQPDHTGPDHHAIDIDAALPCTHVKPTLARGNRSGWRISPAAWP